MVEIRSEIDRLWGVKSLGQSRSAWYIFRLKAVWVTSENGDGRAEKPSRYDVPQVVGVKNRHEPELSNHFPSRIGVKTLGVFILLNRTVPRKVAAYRFVEMVCHGLPFLSQ